MDEIPAFAWYLVCLLVGGLFGLAHSITDESTIYFELKKIQTKIDELKEMN